MKKCAFCSAQAKKLSREHIWDDWLNNVLPTQRFRVRKQLVNGKLLEYDAVRVEETVEAVCGDCNSGWMSEISHRIKQTFSDVIVNFQSGTRISLLPSGIRLLAEYTFLKSVIGDYATGTENDPFFTRAARERFREHRIIPAEVQIWLAAFQGGQRYSGKFSTRFNAANDPGFQGLEFFTFTYVVGPIVVQCSAPRWKHIHQKANLLPKIDLDPTDCWKPAVTEFWPSDGSPVTWPSQKLLGDPVIKTFIDRPIVKLIWLRKAVGT